jgi:riboflavin synthase
MFSGIVELTVKVAAIRDAGPARRLTLPCPWPDVAIGQSVAVNGCCLTIAALAENRMEFDVVPQTLSLTNLGQLAAGDEVHLERALRVGDRLDGHMVQGHIDGTARLAARNTAAGECRLSLQPPPALAKFIIPQGSVALDGISLTVAAVKGDSFEVALIPSTLQITALGRRPIGWLCNLEADNVAKTVIFFLEQTAIVAQSSTGRT